MSFTPQAFPPQAIDLESLIGVDHPKPQFNSISSKRVVGLSPIYFTFLKISVAKLVTLLSLYMCFTPQAFPPQAIDL